MFLRYNVLTRYKVVKFNSIDYYVNEINIREKINERDKRIIIIIINIFTFSYMVEKVMFLSQIFEI